MSAPNIPKLYFTVVSFTNITDEDFTHRFDGTPYTVKAKETLFFPKFLALHLGKHLVKRIVTKEFKTVPQNSGKVMPREGTPAFNNILKQIVSVDIAAARDDEQSQDSVIQREIERMNKEFGPQQQDLSKLNKKDLIGMMKKRGIEIDVSATNEEMRKRIQEHDAIVDATGRTPEGEPAVPVSDQNPDAAEPEPPADEEEPKDAPDGFQHDLRDIQKAGA